MIALLEDVAGWLDRQDMTISARVVRSAATALREAHEGREKAERERDETRASAAEWIGKACDQFRYRTSAEDHIAGLEVGFDEARSLHRDAIDRAATAEARNATLEAEVAVLDGLLAGVPDELVAIHNGEVRSSRDVESAIYEVAWLHRTAFNLASALVKARDRRAATALAGTSTEAERKP